MGKGKHWGSCHMRRVGVLSIGRLSLNSGPSTATLVGCETVDEFFLSEPVWRSIKCR